MHVFRWDGFWCENVSCQSLLTIYLPSLVVIGAVGNKPQTLPKIRIWEGTWMSANLNAWINKIVLEEKMGFPTRMISTPSQEVPEDGDEWRALAKAVVRTCSV